MLPSAHRPRDKQHAKKGLRRRNSPTCTLSQNGYGDGSVAQHGTTSNAKVTQKDRRLGSCVGGFSLVALSLTVAPPGTPAQVLAFRIDTHKRQATWATPSHGPPVGRGFCQRTRTQRGRKLPWRRVCDRRERRRRRVKTLPARLSQHQHES